MYEDVPFFPFTIKNVPFYNQECPLLPPFLRDRHIVGPLLEALPRHGDWRILVSPDHRTSLRTRAHAYGPVPFAIAGTGIAAKGQTSYDEVVAAASDMVFEKGHLLMRQFLGC